MIGTGKSSRQMVRCWLDGLGAGNETCETYEDSVVLGDNDIRVMNLRGVVANVRLLNLIMPFWKSRINDSSYSGPFLLSNFHHARNQRSVLASLRSEYQLTARFA